MQYFLEQIQIQNFFICLHFLQFYLTLAVQDIHLYRVIHLSKHQSKVKTPDKFASKKILHFIMIFKVGLPSLNAIFSGPKSPNDKVSVLIRKRITSRFQNSPYFYFQCHFYGSYDHLNMGPLFLGHPVSIKTRECGILSHTGTAAAYHSAASVSRA